MPERSPAGEQLADVLAAWAAGDSSRADVARTIEAVVGAAVRLGERLGSAFLVGGLDEPLGLNASGDAQKVLDAEANELFADVLADMPVAAMASEEDEHARAITPGAPLVVALDPLDGSGNLGVDGPMGMIFSIRPAAGTAPDDEFRRPGTEQLAAGFVLYGPATVLVLSTGDGTDLYAFERERSCFVRVGRRLRVPHGTPDYSVNASNARHWTPEFRAYVSDLQAGAEGLRGRDFRMRWHGALVIEAFRILRGGGVYLYPADARPGRGSGSIRLVYEAHPIAYLVEQAGGDATDGHERILERRATELHERTPLVFGSSDKVSRVGRYLSHLSDDAERQPLFAARGLFRD